MLVDQIDIWN